MTCDAASLTSEKQKPTTDRQTDRGLEEHSPHPKSSPLCPTLKESQTLATQHPHPTPSSICGAPHPHKGRPQGSSHPLPSLWFAPGNSVRASFLQPPAQLLPRRPAPTRTFSPTCGLPDPGSWGSGARQLLCPRLSAPDSRRARAHTAAPLSLRSGAERWRLMRGGVVYGG